MVVNVKPIFIPELENLIVDTSIHPYLSLRKGVLEIEFGYIWDGATGVPANKDNLRGSLYHDALYELMGLGLLSRLFRDTADQVLRQVCIEDGMTEGWADTFYNFVHSFGASHTLPDPDKYKIYTIE